MGKVCGAVTRKGTKCKKMGLENGRCRLHGGKSTGPKNRKKKSEQMKDNKNALKTGVDENISYNTLTDEEKELYEQINIDPSIQINGRYKIIEIRTLRVMKRYTAELKKVKPDESLLERFEAALTRIDARAIELIRENRALLEKGEDVTDDSPLLNLVAVIDGMRKDRQVKN